MDIFDIFKSLKAEDIPIKTIPEQEQLLTYLKTVENTSFQEISNHTNITMERLMDINQEISLHFKNNLGPKVFYKAMTEASDDNNEQFKQFFQRTDVDLCCNFMFKIKDIRDNMKNLNTPSFVFLKENWIKYRGY